jgi:hypothetical protein
MDVRIKRAYEPPATSDGYRVLIDRIWPRGVSRQQAQLGEWARELAPSSELRRWFDHDLLVSRSSAADTPTSSSRRTTSFASCGGAHVRGH